MQAHWNAQQHTDEFVMDLLVSLDKLSTLVQELLVIEVGSTLYWPHDCGMAYHSLATRLWRGISRRSRY